MRNVALFIESSLPIMLIPLEKQHFRSSSKIPSFPSITLPDFPAIIASLVLSVVIKCELY